MEIVRKADSSMQRFIIAKNGKPKVVIMSVDEYEGWLETLDILSDKNALKEIKEAKKEISNGKYYTFEEVFKKPVLKKK